MFKMHFTDDQDLIYDFHKRAGHSSGSVKSYKSSFDLYRKFHNMTLCDLLDEAILEQEQELPVHRLSIYDRIVAFRDFLAENYVANTVNSSVSKILTFYRYNRIKIPFIPPLNPRTLKRNDEICFEDLPTKDELRLALEFAGDDLKLWILVLISSGSSRIDAKSMTNRTFFEGTWPYHKKDNFKDALECLECRDDVVCTCKLVRQKTDKPYYTFLNPECVQEIARVKLKQGDFDLDSPLLKYSINHVSDKFRQLNDYLGFGRVGGCSRIRSHMLRKFHASYLNQGNLEDDSLNMDKVDALHGRGVNNMRTTYYKNDPEYLKQKYIEAMSNIALYHIYEYEVVGGEVKVFARPL
jgi:integrase